MVGVVIVGDACFVGGLSTLQVFAGSGANEVGAEWSEQVAGGFVDVDGRMPGGVDLMFDGECGTCAVQRGEEQADGAMGWYGFAIVSRSA